MKIYLFVVSILFMTSCSKSEQKQAVKEEKPAFVISDKEQPKDDKLLSLEEANKKAEEYETKLRDAEKKMNHSGKAFALRLMEKKKVTFRKTSPESKTLKSVVRKLEEYQGFKFRTGSIPGKDKMSFRMVFAHSKDKQKCIMFSQLNVKEKDFYPEEDKYPLEVNSNLCKKIFK